MGLMDKIKNNSTDEMDKAELVKLIKEYFDKAEIKYDFEEKEGYSTYVTGAMGDDLPILMLIHISDESLSFSCPLKLKAAPDNYQKVVWELNLINKNLIYGAFYLDPEDGFIVYEYGFPYTEARFTEEFFLGFIRMIYSTVDEHDGDLKKIAETVPREEYLNMYF